MTLFFCPKCQSTNILFDGVPDWYCEDCQHVFAVPGKHEHFMLTDDQGNSGIVLGDPDMRDETIEAIRRLITAAHTALNSLKDKEGI